jgi:effector-binding domain-containing protein
MNYDIHVKQLPPQVVVTERCHTRLPELGKTMHATLAKVATSVEPSEAAQGAPFAVYYNEPFKPDDIDVEMGLPVSPDAHVAETKGVHRRELPGGPVAYTLHVGP